jgi:hypothetical protein
MTDPNRNAVSEVHMQTYRCTGEKTLASLSAVFESEGGVLFVRRGARAPWTRSLPPAITMAPAAWSMIPEVEGRSS